MGTATNPWTLTGSGVFTNYQCNDFASILDGTSSTIAFSEALVSDAPPQHRLPRRGRGRSRLAGSGGQRQRQQGRGHGRPADLQPVVASQAEHPGNEDKGYRWASGSPGVAVFNTIVPPNLQHIHGPAAGSTARAAGSSSASTKTPPAIISGGVNVLFCDGSVTSSRARSRSNIWWALGTKAGSEVIPKESY